MSSSYQFLYEVIIIGEGGVGKSSLTHRFLGDEFDEAYDPTIEGTYRTVAEVDGAEVSIEITDTAGQDSFREIVNQYYTRMGAGYILVFSLTARESFLALKSKIYDDLIETKKSICSISAQQRVPLILVGNKADLQSNRSVQLSEAQAQAREWGCKFFETSAKLNENINEAFVHLIREMNAVRNPVKPEKAEKGKCCTLL